MPHDNKSAYLAGMQVHIHQSGAQLLRSIIVTTVMPLEGHIGRGIMRDFTSRSTVQAAF